MSRNCKGWQESEETYCSRCDDPKTMFARGWILAWSLRLDCEPTPEAVGAKIIELTHELESLKIELKQQQLIHSFSLSCPMEED